MKILIKASILATTTFLVSGCITLPENGDIPVTVGNNLPGSFPITGGIFRGPYEKQITTNDWIGDWHVMANGRVYKISIEDNDGIPVISGRGMGEIIDASWTTENAEWSAVEERYQKHRILTFTRKVDRIGLKQKFTGYFMHYSYTHRNGGTPDYKRRIAGLFEQIRPTDLNTGQIGSWYATRPATTCANKPNLTVSNAKIDFNAQTVEVSVINNGGKDAGAHLTYIEVNEVNATSSPQAQYSVNISGIAKGEEWSSGAIPFSAFSQPRLDLSTFSNGKFVVRADAKGMVDECNEDDNIYAKIVGDS